MKSKWDCPFFEIELEKRCTVNTGHQSMTDYFYIFISETVTIR